MTNRQLFMNNTQTIPGCDLAHFSTEQLLTGTHGNYASLSGIQCHYCDGIEKHTGVRRLPVNKGFVAIFLLEGQFECQVDGVPLIADSATASTGFLVYIPRPTTIERTFEEGRRIKKYVVTIPFDLLSVAALGPFADNTADQSATVRNIYPHDDHLAALWQLRYEADCSFPRTLWKEKTLFEILAHYLSLTQWFEEDADASKKSVQCSAGATQADWVRRQINMLLAEGGTQEAELQLDRLAASANMSVSKLQRLFKQRYNVTVSTYVRQARLNNVYKHLSDGRVTIGEAAYQAGYRHVSNFSNAFKEVFGVTPGYLVKHRE